MGNYYKYFSEFDFLGHMLLNAGQFEIFLLTGYKQAQMHTVLSCTLSRGDFPVGQLISSSRSYPWLC